MGSFNIICSLTGDVISSSDETIMILLTPKGRFRSLGLYPWDDYSPIPMVFSGIYDGYGSLNNIKLFQSRSNLNTNELDDVENFLYDSLSKLISTNNESYSLTQAKNLTDLFGDNKLSFVKKDSNIEILKSLIALKEDHEPKELLHMINVYIRSYTDYEPFDCLDEAQKAITQLDNDSMVLIPMQFMYFKKYAYLKIVNEYGNIDEDKVNIDIFSQVIQNKRTNNIELDESTRCVMLGEHSYAGSNYPAFYLSSLDLYQKKEVSNIKNHIDKLENLYIYDLTLMNDYFMMLGNTWKPSLTINESIKDYGHNEALEFRNSLLGISK